MAGSFREVQAMGFEASGMDGTWRRWARPGAAYQVAIGAAILLAVAIAATTQAADRVALVIGNSKYQGAELRNPANDADALAEALKGLDFTMIKKKDLDRRQMGWSWSRSFARPAVRSRRPLARLPG
jgi:hypothetical protein